MRLTISLTLAPPIAGLPDCRIAGLLLDILFSFYCSVSMVVCSANHFLSTADLAAAAIGGNGAAAAAVSPSGKRTTSTTASTIVGGNTAAAGGSSTSGSVASSGANQSECLLCSARFTLFKRPHHCRFCGACCCDDCSKKRVSIEGSPVRLSVCLLMS